MNPAHNVSLSNILFVLVCLSVSLHSCMYEILVAYGYLGMDKLNKLQLIFKLRTKEQQLHTC